MLVRIVSAGWLPHADAMRRERLVVGLAASVLAACSDGVVTESSRGAILNGEALAEAWPTVGWTGTCTTTLLHANLAVLAAHCPLDFKLIKFERSVGSVVRGVARCATHPDAERGTDLAYCLLEPSEPSLIPIPPLAGCEVDAAQSVERVTIVGYGRAGEGAPAAARRGATATIYQRSERMLIIGDDSTGSCEGDSGGPAFVAIDSGRGTEWRQLGVRSSGEPGTCGRGWYTPLAEQVGWIERDAGVDLTPCFDDELRWGPTPECLAPPYDARGLPDGSQEISSTCGEPQVVDRRPPYAAGAGCTWSPHRAVSGAPALAALLLSIGLKRRRARLHRRPGPNSHLAKTGVPKRWSAQVGGIPR